VEELKLFGRKKAKEASLQTLLATKINDFIKINQVAY
jgi:hypothetical protein